MSHFSCLWVMRNIHNVWYSIVGSRFFCHRGLIDFFSYFVLIVTFYRIERFLQVRVKMLDSILVGWIKWSSLLMHLKYLSLVIGLVVPGRLDNRFFFKLFRVEWCSVSCLKNVCDEFYYMLHALSRVLYWCIYCMFVISY